MDYKVVLQSIRQKHYQAIYLLHGEEPYFIDCISQFIANEILEESEKDFNQSVFYGKDVEPLQLISLAQQFPMMSERQVIIIKEAQDIKDWDVFTRYFEQPMASTILVLCHKYKKFDSRKKAFKAIAKNGLVFQSDKVKDYQLSTWIESTVKEKGFSITSKATSLLGEFLGNDLGKIIGEIDKLALLLEKGTQINDVHIEENIGISKDFNIFELTNAIAEKNTEKAIRIVNYFAHNPKAGNIVVVVGNLFSYFQRMMYLFFSNDKSPQALASNLGIHPFVAKQLLEQSRGFNPKKVAGNIQLLQQYDLKSKGLGSYTSSSELMKELVFRLIH
jgi:DNA polymerase-3 subunit delta